MTNEVGVRLDANGYAPSILTQDCDCYICKAPVVARHELFRSAYREKSKALGLWIPLCPHHHDYVHQNGDLDEALRRQGQLSAMRRYDWTTDDFRKRFGKNYL